MGQLICALSGGKLIQHTTGHAGAPHLVTFSDGSSSKTSSIHHQMMFPYELPKDSYDLIGWSTFNLSSCYHNGLDENIELFPGFVEPEVIWFKETKGFAVQGHPEMMNPNSDFCKKLTEYFNTITNFEYVSNSVSTKV